MTPYKIRARLSAALAAGLATVDAPPSFELEGVISVAVMRNARGARVYSLAGSPPEMTGRAIGSALWKLGGEVLADAEAKSCPLRISPSSGVTSPSSGRSTTSHHRHRARSTSRTTSRSR